MATVVLGLFFVDRSLGISIDPLALGVWWWLRIALFFSVVALAGLSITIVVRRSVGETAERVLLLAVAALAVTAATVANPRPYRLIWRHLDLAHGVVLASLVAGLVATSLVPFRFAGAALVRRLCLAASCLLMAWSIQPRTPVEAAVPEGIRDAVAGQEESPRLLVIGLDGADWNWIEALAARGEMTQIMALRARGAWSRLETFRPSQSPVLWTTMATGARPEDHGVRGHTIERPAGLRIGMPSTRMRVSYFGLEWLRTWLRNRDQLVLGPVTASERRVPALWNVNTFFQKPLSVVGWWATWPAEPILGRMVTDRLHYDRARARGATDRVDEALTYPAELTRPMRRLVLQPEDVDYEIAQRFLDVTEEEYAEFAELSYKHHDVRSEFRYYYSIFESDRRFVRELFRQDEQQGRAPGSMLMLFRIIDHTSHCCLRFSYLTAGTIDSSDVETARFSRVTAEAYREADATVGELVERFGSANVVLLSDHGFVLEKDRGGQLRYNHQGAPPGIFVGAGPAFVAGEVPGMDLYDVFPLLLYLQGLPVDESGTGSLRNEMLDPDYRARHPVLRVPDYGFIPRRLSESTSASSDQEVLEELRALGYI